MNVSHSNGLGGHLDIGSKRGAERSNDSDLSSDDDKPLSKKPRTSTSNGGHGNGNGVSKSADSNVRKQEESDLSSEDDDAPLSTKKRPAMKEEDVSSDSDAPLGKVKATKPAIRRVMAKSASADDSSDSDAPLTMSKSNGASKEKDQAEEEDEEEEDDNDEEEGGDDDDDDDDDAESSSPKKGRGQKIEHSGSGEAKWKTLYHTGPRFPPAYEPLPKAVKMKYDGEWTVSLLPAWHGF